VIKEILFSQEEESAGVLQLVRIEYDVDFSSENIRLGITRSILCWHAINKSLYKKISREGCAAPLTGRNMKLCFVIV
jgi:hypothetical protein